MVKRKAYDDEEPSAGPSSSRSAVLVALDKPSATKKARASGKKPAPVTEKRGAVFRKAPAQAVRDRLDRVMSQRFFMIDRRRNGDELREEFSILGSTGNVYTVTIGKTPSCDCPDAGRGNHCKHILFVFLKVLQVPQSSTHWYQRALLTSELEEIFANARPSPTSVANTHIREAYARATGKAVASSSSTAGQNRRVPGPDDDCPICYENMHGAKEGSLAFCQECGNGLHNECFRQWAATARQKGNQVTCVFCRAKWITAGSTASGSSSNYAEGYINLGDAAGLSPTRDTSSYYQGYRRRKPYYHY